MCLAATSCVAYIVRMESVDEELGEFEPEPEFEPGGTT
jgi:hypothetical protein